MNLWVKNGKLKKYKGEMGNKGNGFGERRVGW